MLTAKTISEIKKLGLVIDHNDAFGGKSKGNKHLSRVVRIAKFLAQKTGADVSIAVAGAALHDTALPSGNDYVYARNKRIVKDLLKPFNLSKQEVDAIAECVASHEGTPAPKTLEAKIVHDADVLEKVGILGIIRHTWKMTNSGKINPEMITDKDVKMVIDHIAWRTKRLQTKPAIKIGKYLTISIDKKKAGNIVAISSKLAFEGVITEKIAIAIQKYLSETERMKLKEQLTITYLAKIT